MKKRIAVLSIGLIAIFGAAGCAEESAPAKDKPAAEKPDSSGMTVEEFVTYAIDTGQVSMKDIRGAQQLERLIGYEKALRAFESGYGKSVGGMTSDEVFSEMLTR